MKSWCMVLLAALTCAGSSFAGWLGENITVYDGRSSYANVGWKGTNEDQEVEVGDETQSWDYEAQILQGDQLTIISGFNLIAGEPYGSSVIRSGDIWIDVDGVRTSTDPGMGFDYVLDLNVATMTYDVYKVDSTLTMTEGWSRPWTGDPYRRLDGGQKITNGVIVSLGTLTDADLADYGLVGGTHYGIAVDVSFLNGAAFFSHLTQTCRNDWLRARSGCRGLIGDFVWHDQNRDGLQDDGEPGIDGVTVNLFDGQGQFIASTITGPNGFYAFAKVCPGTYIVDVDETTLPPGFAPTAPAQGGDVAKDSNGPLDGGPAMVTLPSESPADITIDFGYVSPCEGVIGDFVWDDLNRNGVQDAGEPGIALVVLNLLDAQGSVLATATTDTNGFYQFSGLCAGAYYVDVVESTLQAEYVPTAPLQGGDAAADSNGALDGSAAAVTLSGDTTEDLTIDFGYFRPCSGKIGDFVWTDANRNGVQDEGEFGIPDVTVTLLDGAGSLLGYTVTDTNGYYAFDSLCAGTYYIDVDEASLPAGVVPSDPFQGGDPATDSNGPLDGSPAAVTLPTDFTTDLTIDFGYNRPCSGRIGNFVWVDANRNGVQDEGEAGIASVTVSLLDAQGALLAFTVTDANGYYEFGSLCGGDYQVDVDESTLPAGYTLTTPFAGGDTAKDSNGPVGGGAAAVTLGTDFSVDLTIDFGYQPKRECCGKIGNFVWKDCDRDGIQDCGEPGIGGAKVNLYDAQGNLIATAITDSCGRYTFTGLCEGRYFVDVDESTLPLGYTPTLPLKGTDRSKDSNGPADGGRVEVSLVGDCACDLTIDFGYQKRECCGKIGNFVWKDCDRDGIQDCGEPGIGGAKVNLYDAQGNLIATTVTDGSGLYTFSGLCAGRYYVEVDESTLPFGYIPTAPFKGCDRAKDSNGPADGGLVEVNLSGDCCTDLTIDFGYICSEGGQGLTPGFWKQRQHYRWWTAPYTPSTQFSAVFDNAFPGKTLLQVLQQGGGGLNALGRHTVAALLNAASPNVSYDMSVSEVINSFNSAYPGSNSSYETLKNKFAGYNEQGL